MGYNNIVQEFVGEIDNLNECELYLSISLAFMSIKNWIEANYFLNKASLLADQYRYNILVSAFMDIIIQKDYKEVERLLDSRKYKYIKYEFVQEQFK